VYTSHICVCACVCVSACVCVCMRVRKARWTDKRKMQCDIQGYDVIHVMRDAHTLVCVQRQ